MNVRDLIVVYFSAVIVSVTSPCGPCSAQDVRKPLEKPWVDIYQSPINSAEIGAAGISDFLEIRESKVFILVKPECGGCDEIFRPGGNPIPSATSYFNSFKAEASSRNPPGGESVQIMSLSGRALIQMGNAHFVKTFEVSGANSVCEASSKYLQCATGGKILRVETN